MLLQQSFPFIQFDVHLVYVSTGLKNIQQLLIQTNLGRFDRHCRIDAFKVDTSAVKSSDPIITRHVMSPFTIPIIMRL